MIDLLVCDRLWCALADEGMGPISDRVNQQRDISREIQDEFAAETTEVRIGDALLDELAAL